MAAFRLFGRNLLKLKDVDEYPADIFELLFGELSLVVFFYCDTRQ